MSDRAAATAFGRLLDPYRRLLEELDGWFASCIEQFPTKIQCAAGCSSCCRGLFEISLLDAALLQQGFQLLPAEISRDVLTEAGKRRDALQRQWPGLEHPYILNRLPHNDWEEMPEDDPTPCPLLDENRRCLVYRHRPLICRLHGLPHVDLSGKVFMKDYCTLNFPGVEADKIAKLRYRFHTTYQREFDLLGEFSELILGKRDLEIDTFIPLALFIDFSLLSGSGAPGTKP